MKDSEQWFDQGNDALALGELEEAAHCYRKAVEADESYFEGWHALGMALLKAQDYPQAVTALKRAIELSPNDQIAYTSLSMAYMKNGQIKEAEDAAAKARVISWGGKAEALP